MTDTDRTESPNAWVEARSYIGRARPCALESPDGLVSIGADDDEPANIRVDIAFAQGSVVVWVPLAEMKRALAIVEAFHAD